MYKIEANRSSELVHISENTAVFPSLKSLWSGTTYVFQILVLQCTKGKHIARSSADYLVKLAGVLILIKEGWG